MAYSCACMSIFVSQVCHSRHFFASHLCPFVFLLSVCSFFIFVFKLLVYADYDPYAVAGVCNDHGKTYALYAITVHRRSPNSEETWKTYRRYSDFHDFHMRITEQVINLIKSFQGFFERCFFCVMVWREYWLSQSDLRCGVTALHYFQLKFTFFTVCYLYRADYRCTFI